MTEPFTITPIEPDISAHVSTLRRAAIVMFGIALAGFVFWSFTTKSKARWESAASITSESNTQRPVFREKDGAIYVSVPDAAPVDSGIGARQPYSEQQANRSDAPVIVAMAPRPEQKLPRAPLDKPAAASPDEPSATIQDEPYTAMEDEGDSADPVRDQSTMNEPMWAEQMTDEGTDEPEDSMSDESEWDEPSSSDTDEPDDPSATESDTPG